MELVTFNIDLTELFQVSPLVATIAVIALIVVYIGWEWNKVLNMRYASEKPIIVTTNLTQQELEEPDSLDKKRVYDRVVEMCHFIEIKGESRRAEMAAKREKRFSKFLGLED